MNITSIRLKKNNSGKGRLLGTASVEFDNCLVIHGIKLIQLKTRRGLSFPDKKIPKYNYNDEGSMKVGYEYADIVHPSNKEFRDYVESELYKLYDSEEVEKYE